MKSFIETIEQGQFQVGNQYHLSLDGYDPLNCEPSSSGKSILRLKFMWDFPCRVNGHEVTVVLFTRDAIGGIVPITQSVLAHIEIEAVILDISIENEIVSFLVDSSMIKRAVVSFYHLFRNPEDGEARVCGQMSNVFVQSGYNCKAVIQTIDAKNSSASYNGLDQKINGQYGFECDSVIPIMMLNIPCGAIIRFTICGPDAHRMAELLSHFSWEFFSNQDKILPNPEVRVISRDGNPVTVYTSLDYDIPTGEFTFHRESLWRLMDSK